MSSRFYVYVHRRASDGRIFYVGKGSGNRARQPWMRNKWWKHTVGKHGLNVEIVAWFENEADAFALERDLIAWYGRDVLVNLTDGGEGATGYVDTRAQVIAKSLVMDEVRRATMRKPKKPSRSKPERSPHQNAAP